MMYRIKAVSHDDGQVLYWANKGSFQQWGTSAANAGYDDAANAVCDFLELNRTTGSRFTVTLERLSHSQEAAIVNSDAAFFTERANCPDCQAAARAAYADFATPGFLQPTCNRHVRKPG